MMTIFDRYIEYKVVSVAFEILFDLFGMVRANTKNDLKIFTNLRC